MYREHRQKHKALTKWIVKHVNYVIPFYSWKLLTVRLSQTAQNKISTEARTILEEDDQRILLLEKVTDPEGGNPN